MRVLSPRIHGYLDFVVVLIFLLAPLSLGLGGTPALVCYVLAIVHLLMTLMTRFPAGIYKSIPLLVHGLVELAVAIFLVLLPYVAGFGPGSPAKRFSVTMAGIIFVVWLITDYRSAGSGETLAKG